MQTSNIGPQKTAFENLSPRAYFRNSFYDRLQNSPYFCVFKYARAVEQKVGNEAENRERDWGHTPYGRVILARFACVRLLRHTLPISLLILRKKPTVLQSTSTRSHWQSPSPMSTTRVLAVFTAERCLLWTLEGIATGMNSFKFDFNSGRKEAHVFG